MRLVNRVLQRLVSIFERTSQPPGFKDDIGELTACLIELSANLGAALLFDAESASVSCTRGATAAECSIASRSPWTSTSSAFIGRPHSPPGASRRAHAG